VAPLRFNTAQQSRAMQFAFLGVVVPIAIATATDFSSHRTLFFIGAAGGCLATLIVNAVPRRNRIAFYIGVFGGIPSLAMMQAGISLGVVVVDLDDLKQINDSMGHEAGDRVLRETADRMRAALRGGDVLARPGGDEFAALLTDATLDGVLEVVRRLRDVTPSPGRFRPALPCGTVARTSMSCCAAAT
jgi:hypothetical protein